MHYTIAHPSPAAEAAGLDGLIEAAKQRKHERNT